MGAVIQLTSHFYGLVCGIDVVLCGSGLQVFCVVYQHHLVFGGLLLFVLLPPSNCPFGLSRCG